MLAKNSPLATLEAMAAPEVNIHDIEDANDMAT